MFAHDVGSGTPVVFFHGFGLDHRSVLPLDPIFEQSGGRRRIYLDLPGATRTPAGSIESTQQVADAAVAEIRHRVGDEKFAILGNSFGGMIARFVAHELRSQVVGLATVAGVFVAQHSARSVPVRTVLHREPRIEAILGASLEHYRADAVVESTADARAFLQHVLPGIDGADSAAIDRIAQSYSLDREPELAHPESFTAPTLHITGRQDDVVGYTDSFNLIEHYPRATFAALDAAGHNILFEQHGLCTALISEWLQRVRRGS